MDRIIEKIELLENECNDTAHIDQNTLENYGLTDIKLREYQVVGINWMIERLSEGHGFILGDEMGLGKTCQAISLLVSMAGSGQSNGPHLLISPLSVLNNWQSELERFAPHFKFIMYVGDKDTRAELRRKFKSSTNILLTTYEICLKDNDFLSRYDWNTLVVDEAHRLKNRESQLHQTLLEFEIKNHVLLTGTPIQNNLRELYALLCFIAPKIFKYRYCDDFVETYSDVEEKTCASEIHKILKPFILRRTKTQVLKDLPKRTEVVLYHGLAALQKKFYKAILTKDTEVFDTNQNAPRTRLMNVLMQLRKCVNHPYLFDGVEPEPFQLGEHLVDVSGKLTLVDQLLAYLQPLGHKVLIFSQMTHMLDIVQDYLGYRGYSYERLDGSVRGEERYLAIKNFNMDENTFIFLLSTKAGGVGLNLTSADTVIFIDSDFNPQNDLQAAARAHRIGQKRQVKIIRLIGRSTVEEIILKRAEAKLKLTETVIEGDQFSQGASSSKVDASSIANTQLQDILKFGVDKLLENDDSSIESVDFDSILGPTENGEWTDIKDKETVASLASETMLIEDIDEEDEDKSNMYKYEGTDYSLQPSAADKKAIDELIQTHKKVIEEGGGEGPSLRKMKTTTIAGLLPTPVRQKRKPLTPEELAERNRKRAETLAKKAREAEEEDKRKKERRLERRAAMWEENNYISSKIEEIDSDESDEEDEEDDTVMETNDTEIDDHDIKYVSGDVTNPQYALENDAIVVHCVDDSGAWGSGGLFTALSNRSSLIQEQYELAWEMRDLQLGDVHLIAIDPHQERLKGNDYVALIVAQHRDKRGSLSGIKMDSLSDGLKKVYRAAKERKAGVHLPRIGYATPGFNWYGTERLIRKHLASRKIPTYIYYYKRHQGQGKKRKTTATPTPSTSRDYSEPEDNDEEPLKKAKKYDVKNNNLPSNSASHRPVKVEGKLPDYMQGVAVYYIGLEADVKATLSRYLVAFDGDVHSDIEDVTTHLVVKGDPEFQHNKEIEEILEAYPSLEVVTQKWLYRCFGKGKRVPTAKFAVKYG